MLRINSGFLRNRLIHVPTGLVTRPTQSRTRAAIGNMLQPYLEGAKILDAFAGSGALGIELISRGADSCLFIEQSSKVCDLLHQSIKLLGIESQCHVLCGALPGALKNVTDRDIIIADPPYGQDWHARLLEPFAVAASQQAYLCFEREKKDMSLGAVPWVLKKDKLYGDTRVTLYERS